MPYIISVILMSLVGPLVGYAIKALGIGLVSYVGFSVVLDQAEDYIYSAYDGLFPSMLQLMDLMGVHSALKILLSTAASCIAYKSMAASVGIAWKKPGAPGGFTKTF